MNKVKRILRYDLPLHFALLFTNWLPDNVIFIRLRGRLIRPFFKSCGKRFGVGRNVTFYKSWKMNIGNDVYVAYGSWLGGDVTIEDEVLIGPYCILAPSNHTKKNGSYRFSENTDGKISVGKGSWMGAKSLIVEGGNLSRGSVLAANSLLNQVTEPNSIYAGSPAKNIGYNDV